MATTRTVPSEPQRDVIAKLKKLFGEKDYLIYPSPDWYARSDIDFLAAKRRQPTQLMSIRATPHGLVSITPFADIVSFEDIRNIVESARKNSGVQIRWMAKLTHMAYVNVEPNAWDAYFPPQAQEEIEALKVFPR